MEDLCLLNKSAKNLKIKTCVNSIYCEISYGLVDIV